MKYMLTWTERPQGSPIEYENAQSTKSLCDSGAMWLVLSANLPAKDLGQPGVVSLR
jgi:hypothetical protein